MDKSQVILTLEDMRLLNPPDPPDGVGRPGLGESSLALIPRLGGAGGDFAAWVELLYEEVRLLAANRPAAFATIGLLAWNVSVTRL